ncbi:hypothetical protein DVH24_003950 [Malus domestica]|uniref:Uncharacterized protein n=1 Tax=Malus domestica TaxID=3750 RepID=A0A498K7C2_MALDO|nr:hypothetical protein DVH24_003950 [Malus domestica]
MDGDNPASHLCSPEGLLQQARGLLINNGSLGCCFVDIGRASPWSYAWHGRSCRVSRFNMDLERANMSFF